MSLYQTLEDTFPDHGPCKLVSKVLADRTTLYRVSGFCKGLACDVLLMKMHYKQNIAERELPGQWSS